MHSSLFKVAIFPSYKKRVVILMGGWKTRPWLYYVAILILRLRGFSCLLYTYDDEIFSPDTKATVVRLQAVCNDVLDRIEAFRCQGYESFAILGYSLGTVLSLMIANRSSVISSVILDLSGAGVAEAVWNWTGKDAKFRQALERQGFNMQRLIEVWAVIAPRNNIDALQGKRLLLYLSKRDKLIPYGLGLELEELFRRHGYVYRTITNTWLGHGLAGLLNLLNAPVFLRELSNL